MGWRTTMRDSVTNSVKDDVGNQCDESDDGKRCAVFLQQDDGDQQYLQQGGQDVEQREVEQKTDAARTAFDVAGHCRRSPIQMEAQAQACADVRTPAAPHGGWHAASPWRTPRRATAEQGAEQAQQTVARPDEEHRHHQHGMRTIQRIDDLLQRQRDRHVGEFGKDQQPIAIDHACLELP